MLMTDLRVEQDAPSAESSAAAPVEQGRRPHILTVALEDDFQVGEFN